MLQEMLEIATSSLYGLVDILMLLMLNPTAFIILTDHCLIARMGSCTLSCFPAARQITLARLPVLKFEL